MDEKCKYLKVIGKGNWVGGLYGRYACQIPYCHKFKKLCKKGLSKEVISHE